MQDNSQDQDTKESKSQLRVAVCGTRGIPACYGGFETFAEELSVRLVERGHKVLVYGRRHVINYSEPSFKGVDICLLPAPRHKYLETPVHALLSFFDLLRRKVDVVLVCNAANSPFVCLLRVFRMPVVINLDGIERKRGKWNMLGRVWYRLGEICSVAFGSRLVADALVIQDYYRKFYRSSCEVIRYGYRKFNEKLVEAKLSGESGFMGEAGCRLFAELGVAPGEYLLYVSRLEPENNALLVIKAYQALPEETRRMPLVVVGDAPYAKDYIASLHAEAGPEVRFAGYRFGEEYCLLQSAAYCYIQATEVGGTHPALVESLGFANCVIANDVPEHREVLAEAGIIYEKNKLESLSQKLRLMLENPNEVQRYRRAAFQRAQEEFDWDKITSLYERLFYSLTGRGNTSSLRDSSVHSQV